MLNTSVHSDFELLESLETPIIWIDFNGQIKWYNRSAFEMFPLIQNEVHWSNIGSQMPSSYIYHLHQIETVRDLGILVECIPETPQILHQELEQIRQQVEDLQQANRELEIVFDALDELYVTDGNGITLNVNRSMEEFYGVKCEGFIGRSVFDLEKEQLFYPSATAMVIRSKKQITIMQRTKSGRQLVVTSTPVFDENGEIVRIISSANDISSVLLSNRKQFRHKIHSLHPGEDSDQDIENETDIDYLYSESPNMKKTIERIHRVAKTNTTVLLLGESGVGKNLMARMLHNLSERRCGPFVEINCASIPESLLESELFGYDPGAFTGARKEGKPGKVELAEGGTLFLNEIGELPLSLQSKLLDLLQERTISRVGGLKNYTVNIRILAATNQKLEQMVKEKKFREDLYYRLTVFPVMIPALRDRVEDLPTLAEYILSKCTSKLNQQERTIDPETLEYLIAYRWPGNIRELENILEQLVILVDEEVILPEHLPDSIKDSMKNLTGNMTENSFLPITSHPIKFSTGAISTNTDEMNELYKASSNICFQNNFIPESGLKKMMAQFERQIFELALLQCKSTYAIAKHLNVSQPTVVRKLQQYGLSI